MRFFTRVLAAAVAASCASGGDRVGAGPEAGTEPAEDVRQEAPDNYQTTRVVDLGEGSHAVFGLRIPRGMRPVAGPHRVYRFEGTGDLVAAKRFVMRQVETARLQEEPAGYLIRGARVLEPAGEADPETRLAVRVFRGRKGGATIDVWAERDRKRERAAAATRGGGAGAAGSSKGGRVEPGSPEARRRVEERRATFELMERLGRGEAPSSDDADNPFFY